jgi:membrane-bound serine protease (ClpP class)
MSGGHELLRIALAKPSVALILLAAGVLGICWELSGATRFLPGILGSAAIVLALGSPAAETFDVRGDLLVAASLLCFLREATLRRHGIFAVAGAVALALGLHRIDPEIGWMVVAVCSVAFALPVSFLLAVAYAARRSKLDIVKPLS